MSSDSGGSGAVLEVVNIVPHPVSSSWVAMLNFIYNGLDHEAFYWLGPITQTEADARLVFAKNNFLLQARAAFLQNVPLTTRQ